MEHVASIELDGGGRGQVYLDERPTYDGESTEWIITVELPTGEFEEPAVPGSRTREEAIEAIDLTWGRGPWDLVWEEGTK